MSSTDADSICTPEDSWEGVEDMCISASVIPAPLSDVTKSQTTSFSAAYPVGLVDVVASNNWNKIPELPIFRENSMESQMLENKLGKFRAAHISAMKQQQSDKSWPEPRGLMMASQLMSLSEAQIQQLRMSTIPSADQRWMNTLVAHSPLQQPENSPHLDTPRLLSESDIQKQFQTSLEGSHFQIPPPLEDSHFQVPQPLDGSGAHIQIPVSVQESYTLKMSRDWPPVSQKLGSTTNQPGVVSVSPPYRSSPSQSHELAELRTADETSPHAAVSVLMTSPPPGYLELQHASTVGSGDSFVTFSSGVQTKQKSALEASLLLQGKSALEACLQYIVNFQSICFCYIL